MAIASTEFGAGFSHGHWDIASIVLPVTIPGSVLPGVKVAKSVVRKTILPDVAGVVVTIPKAGVPRQGRSEGLPEGQEGQT